MIENESTLELLRVRLLVDGDSQVAPVEDGALVIDGRHIVDRGGFAEVRGRWPDVAASSYLGATAIPGLIDSHVHLTLPGNGTPFETGAMWSSAQRYATATENARKHLRAGVTTMRDVGSDRDLVTWRDRLGDDMPRVILCCAPLTGVGGHMHLWGGECSGVDAVRQMVAKNADAGADAVKIAATGGNTVGTVSQVPAFSEAELAAAVAAGHERHQVVTAHALSTESIRRSMRAGVDGIEHMAFLDEDGVPNFTDGLALELADSNIAIGSTLACRYRHVELVEQGKLEDPDYSNRKMRLVADQANARRFHELGGQIVAATDAGWNYVAFGDIFLELSSLHEAGLDTLAVIEAATARQGEYLKLGRVGRLRSGWEADIVILDGLLTEDFTALERVAAVYKSGTRVA